MRDVRPRFRIPGVNAPPRHVRFEVFPLHSTTMRSLTIAALPELKEQIKDMPTYGILWVVDKCVNELHGIRCWDVEDSRERQFIGWLRPPNPANAWPPHGREDASKLLTEFAMNNIFPFPPLGTKMLRLSERVRARSLWNSTEFRAENCVTILTLAQYARGKQGHSTQDVVGAFRREAEVLRNKFSAEGDLERDEWLQLMTAGVAAKPTDWPGDTVRTGQTLGMMLLFCGAFIAEKMDRALRMKPEDMRKAKQLRLALVENAMDVDVLTQ